MVRGRAGEKKPVNHAHSREWVGAHSREDERRRAVGTKHNPVGGLEAFRQIQLGFPRGSVVKNPPANTGDMGSVPGLRRSPGEGNDNRLHYSYLGNPMGREAWWATVHGVVKRHNLGTKQRQTNPTITSPLHTNLQTANFQRCECVFGSNKEARTCVITSGMNETAAPPPPTSSPSSVRTSSCLLAQCQPLYACHCTVLLYLSRHHTVRLETFSLFLIFAFYVLFVWKYYKPITVLCCLGWS